MNLCWPADSVLFARLVSGQNESSSQVLHRFRFHPHQTPMQMTTSTTIQRPRNMPEMRDHVEIRCCQCTIRDLKTLSHRNDWAMSKIEIMWRGLFRINSQ